MLIGCYPYRREETFKKNIKKEGEMSKFAKVLFQLEYFMFFDYTSDIPGHCQ